MNLYTIRSFEDELEKISGSATIGASIGAITALAPSLLKEWDDRHTENQMLMRVPEKERPAAKSFINRNRLHRLGRLAVKTGIMSAGGAALGHYGHKAAVGLADSVSKKITENLKPASEHAAEVLGKGFSKGIKEGGKGLFWKFFKRK